MSGNWAGCVLVGHWMGEREEGGFTWALSWGGRTPMMQTSIEPVFATQCEECPSFGTRSLGSDGPGSPEDERDRPCL